VELDLILRAFSCRDTAFNSGEDNKMANRITRPIKSIRDYKGAASAANKLLVQAEQESAEELRLQALIKEMEKFDDQGADEDEGDGSDNSYELPGRRWSDDGSESWREDH
jgi:hypothetical protein